MQSEIVVGLDIGTTKIAAIAGRRNEFGKIEVLGYGHTESIGVRRGVITTNSHKAGPGKLQSYHSYGKCGYCRAAYP